MVNDADMNSEIRNILKKFWGFDRLRPLQDEAMALVFDKQDSLVVLPTGGGKSLCFQVPAMLMPGLTVVVSPLISLMNDQVEALIQNGIPAARLDSTLSAEEKKSVYARLIGKELKLLYLSPERLVSSDFMELLRSVGKLSSIVVDEAHCVSMWGHDFRPEYGRLGILKDEFDDIAIHAYTATATKQVREDIIRQLKLKEPGMIVGSFDRPNLVYTVKRRANIFNQVSEILDRYKGESGIIYCLRRADVDKLCLALRGKGYNAVPYHAGMTAVERKHNQEVFFQEKADIVVATIAFGMGIDKSNVRYVIHAGMPKSLEHYQQESGRAGRDGLEAECVLFYSGGDYGVWKSIHKGADPETGRITETKLKAMYRYCTGVSCRRKTILSYFGQSYSKGRCGGCDVCLDKIDLFKDSLKISRKILSCIKNLREKYGGNYISSILAGTMTERIHENGHDAIEDYALLFFTTKGGIRDWIEQLAEQGFIRKHGRYNILKLTDSGHEFLNGKGVPRLLEPARNNRRKAAIIWDSWDGVDKDLFQSLRSLRREIAVRKGLPAYIVFDDAALRDMARKKPSSPVEFLEVRGVGEKKNRQYSELFLETISAHHDRSRHG